MNSSADSSLSSVWEARVAMLMQLDAVLASHEIKTRDQFTQVMQAAFGPCRLSMKRFAGHMRVSQSTAHRWVAGVSAPHHESVWAGAAEWIRQEIQREINSNHSSVGAMSAFSN